MPESGAAADLFPLVYDELRKLAAAHMVDEKPGHTLQATALVHEAYVRLVGDQRFTGRGHFFAAAAEAMRRILVENARRKKRLRHGGDRRRIELGDPPARDPDAELLDLDDALSRLVAEDPPAAEIAKLHVFAGRSVDEAAELMGVSRATAYRHWNYAKAWLRCEMSGPEGA
jgi:RNA polymerase sigma factor (TIGR02999 family)